MISGSNRQTNSKGFLPKQERAKDADLPDEDVKRCFKCAEKGHLASQCRSKEIKCFKCKGLGHKSSDCNRNKNESGKVVKKEDGNVQTLTSLSSYRIFKNIIIRNQEISATIDTGSDISCLRNELFLALGDVELESCKKTLTGIGQKDITTLGCFSSNIDVDGVLVPIIFHVVRDQDILYTAIIGNDVLEFVNMTVSFKGVEFSLKSANPSPTEFRSDSIAMQNVLKELSEIEVVGQIGDAGYIDQVDLCHLGHNEQKEIMRMLDDYRPVKPNTFPVKMKIILSD
ncbi:uncharacterized protein LOC119599988 [Lucilia sericata]|uniref:uncharacterized protein LOC119599988 n=1 Tax=Lucilia sericata TaxID=13632 RepID=UPI0018A7F486|nr:uncharacterized protein LOC119599988 [Lucilia sericata]